MADLPPTFGSVLRRYRQAAGLTQEELAERSRLSVRGITDLERGVRRAPHKETVQLLADALALAPPERRTHSEAAARRHGEAPTQLQRTQGGPGIGRPAALGPTANLPLRRTSFVGREQEQIVIRELLAEDKHAGTLTGAGGCGKTRLAPGRGPAGLLPAYPDGVWLVRNSAALGEPV